MKTTSQVQVLIIHLIIIITNANSQIFKTINQLSSVKILKKLNITDPPLKLTLVENANSQNNETTLRYHRRQEILPSYCVMDKVSVHWVFVKSSTLEVDDISLAVTDSTGSKMLLAELGPSTGLFNFGNEDSHDEAFSNGFTLTTNTSDATGSELNQGVIKCMVNPMHCAPSVRSIISYLNQGRLTIVFDQPTNTPFLDSSYAVRSALELTPRLFGGAIGEWTASDTLGLKL